MTLVRRCFAALALLTLLALPAFAQTGTWNSTGGNSRQRVVDETPTTTVAPRATFRQLLQQLIERARAKAAASNARNAATRTAR